MSKKHYDVAVVGIGGMGSAALYHLAKRGVAVCGIEQFDTGHSHGSSHGETRIIRKAYPEEPKYIPLLNRSYELWSELEAASGAELFVKCGFIAISEIGSEFLNTIGEGNRQFNLPHEYWNAQEIQHHFPQYQIPENMAGYFDPLGGFLYVESCVRQHINQAEKSGATIFTNETVIDWQASEGGVEVVTDQRTIQAEKLILTTGSWTAPEIKKLGIPLEIWRRILLWFRSPDLAIYQPHNFPTFVVDLGETVFYGFPAVSDFGIKIGEHNRPFLIDDPAQMQRPITREENAEISNFSQWFFPGLNPQPSKSATCMYTVTPDRHFVIDLHPENQNVVLGCGFSGHGFKFAPAIGEILADLAMEGTTRQAIEFLRIRRFV